MISESLNVSKLVRVFVARALKGVGFENFELRPAVECLVGQPKGSYVVPFWAFSGFLIRNFSILPKKELHRRVWVGMCVEAWCSCSYKDSTVKTIPAEKAQPR